MVGSKQVRRKGGRRTLPVRQRKGLALRLYSVLRRRFANFERFKRALEEQRTQVREVTVRGWLPPLERLDQDPDKGSKVAERDWSALRTPDLPGLREVATVLDVSVDYLLGYPVPARRSDREPTGELARALVEHVVGEYAKRAKHQRRDGLTEVVFGQMKREGVRRKADSAVGPRSDVLRIELADLALSRLVLVVDEPQRLLDLVSQWVFEYAETWEEQNKEPERQAVRDEVRRLVPYLGLLTDETTYTSETILRELLAAALDPLAPRTRGWIKTLGDDVSSSVERADEDGKNDAKLRANMLETVIELERLQVERAEKSAHPASNAEPGDNA